MASTLSYSAIHRIIFLLENDDRPPGTKTGRSRTTEDTKDTLQEVSSTWKAIYELYADIEPAPPLDYLDSLELTLVLKEEVEDGDVHAIFAHGKPLEFWGCPRLLVSKIVEAFSGQQKGPTHLDVTITALPGFGATRPSEAWPQVYITHLPCYACSTVETVKEASIPHQRNAYEDEDPVETVDVAIEKFHISSENFRKPLTVELHYRLDEPLDEPNRRNEQSCFLHKIAIRLANETCSAQGILSGTSTRSSATLLLLPEFALEVFGFLDRAHIGPSLLANRALHDLICQLKQRLPVHHLECRLEDIMIPVGQYQEQVSGSYWLDISHFQHDLTYTDVRRFKVPSTAGAEHDCALILRYLGNSYMADMQWWTWGAAGFPFAIKMLASLAPRNFSVGRLELFAGTNHLSDYRSMDVVFGGLRMSNLCLKCDERRFAEFVKTTDFLRMSTVQRLRELKLTLIEPSSYAQKSRDESASKSPLWVSGIYLLRNCEHYRVNYGYNRDLRSIERKVVQICEKFERGEITDTVEHFQLSTSKAMTFSFNRDNLIVSGMKVELKTKWDATVYAEWDVHRFRNASTSEYLTACVGQYKGDHGTGSILHISKGEVYPDDSFALY